ncbi:alpha/beta hydrolase [Parasalinivibrio latis]|uniref:alpha/beta fold hydrolase n=1 Tax=Parasalinivibrio latis TaxID=2952610 RepID=UPI0030DF1DA0
MPLAYLQAGAANSDTRIIFIHGSPGSKEGYQAYLSNEDLLNRAQLLSVDRLGFGNSGKEVVTSLQQQAEAILPFLDSSRNNILVGHSLGGPIALQLALISPESISGMVLIASAFDPALEQPKWYNYLADTIVANWILPEDMNRSNREMMVLSQELKELADQSWQELTMPIRLLHGDDDTIAAPGNSLFAYARLPTQSTTLHMMKNEGHFVLWQNVPQIVREILSLIEDK